MVGFGFIFINCTNEKRKSLLRFPFFVYANNMQVIGSGTPTATLPCGSTGVLCRRKNALGLCEGCSIIPFPAPDDRVGTQISGGGSKYSNHITRQWGSDLSVFTARRKEDRAARFGLPFVSKAEKTLKIPFAVPSFFFPSMHCQSSNTEHSARTPPRVASARNR